MIKFLKEVLSARRRAAELEHAAAHLKQEVIALNVKARNDEAFMAGQNGQIIQLRQIAGEMRDRVRTHGKTTKEQYFIEQCVSMRKAGKVIGAPRFNQLVDEMIAQRESMKDWASEAQPLEIHERAGSNEPRFASDLHGGL